MVEPQSEPVFPVGFDDDALEEDLAHLPASAEEALRLLQKEVRRLPDTAPAAADPVVARPSSALAERAPHCLGIASAPEQGASFDDLYRAADAALYERKLLRPSRKESPRKPVEANRSCA